MLTPLSEKLSESEPEGVCSVEMAMEAIEDWQIPFLDFLELSRLLDDPVKKVESKGGNQIRRLQEYAISVFAGLNTPPIHRQPQNLRGHE